MAKSESKNDETKPTDEATPAEVGGGRNRKLLLIAAGVAVLVVGSGAGAYFSGVLDSLLGEEHAATEAVADKSSAPKETTFYTLPDVVVSLNTGERKTTFLKMRVSLELTNPGDQAKIERVLPRIIDFCQIYLRELRLDDLRGSAGTVRLREEILRRINAAVAPVVVTNVLFTELFIQ